jgi:chromosome segregation ATPase
MEKQDIINVLEFVKYNQLRTLQWKSAYLRYQIDKLEAEKTEAMEHLFKLKRMIGEAEGTLAQKRKEIAHIDQESGKSDNTGNSDPVTCSEPDAISCSSDSI